MPALLSNYKLPLIIAGLVLVLLLAVFLFGRMSKPSVKFKSKPLPSGGSGIPTNGSGGVWSPDNDVEILRSAMFGGGSGNWWDAGSWGTDEDALLDVFVGKSDDQLTAIYNAYFARYKSELKTDLRSELSGDDLKRALGYLQFI